METVNPNPQLFPDAVMLDFGEALSAAEPELKAIDPVVETLVIRFQRTHQTLKAKLNARHHRQAVLQPLRVNRGTCRLRLVFVMGELWEDVARAGSSWERRKPKEQVQIERSNLFRYGKPTPVVPSAVKLIEMATAAVEILAGDSPLATIWSPAQVEELRTALADFTAASRSVRSAVVARQVSVEGLNQDRLQWRIDFCTLRDTTLNLAVGRADAGRWKVLFADSRPGRPATEATNGGPTGDP